MRSHQDAVESRRGVSDSFEASYPYLLAALATLKAEIAVARVLEVESAMCDIWQTMNDLGIALAELSRYRTFRVPPRASRPAVEHGRRAHA